MTPAEAQVAFKAFVKTVGPEAAVYASLNTNRYGERDVLSAALYPRGVSRGSVFTVSGADWQELYDALEAKWAEHRDTEAERTIRRMALAIIEITADLGACSDAALRAQFSAQEVLSFGERAIADANTIASNGPFSIVTQGAANNEEAA